MHMKKFNAWELISFVLKKSIEGGVAIYWEGKRLDRCILSGQRLKDLAGDSTAGATLLDSSIPGPSGLGGRDLRDMKLRAKERRLFTSATTYQRQYFPR